MALKADFRTTFEAKHVIQPIYTGGSVALSQDGTTLATCLGEDVLISNLYNGKHLARIEGDGDTVTTLTLSPDASYLAICSRTLSMRVFALTPSDTDDDKLDARLIRSLKPHTAPVVVSTVDETGTLLATGGADGVVKVWDLYRGFTTHTLHGHSGVISALRFFQVDPKDDAAAETKSRKRKSRGPDVDVLRDASTAMAAGFRLASGGEDGKVRIWDLHTRKSIKVLDSHVSVVRSLSYSPAQKRFLSASRDKTAIVWDARSWQQLATVPTYESLESAGFVGDGQYFYTGGETARLRIWSVQGREVTGEQPEGSETDAILDIIHGPEFLLSVHADQTLLLHSIEPLASTPTELAALPIIRRISGTHDEIIDLAYIGLDNSLMALATNSEDVRLIRVGETNSEGVDASHFGSDVTLLQGHDDIVITLDTDWSGHWLATGAKDNTARLWRLDPSASSYECYAVFTGHAESISAVALPNAVPPIGSPAHSAPLDHPPAFLITGSQDKTVKRWDLKSQSGTKSIKAVYTRKAHDKEMNAIDVSYNSAMFASASQDRTVKIWDLESGEAIGVLRGHKRGVWTVAFAPPSIPAISGDTGASSGNRGLIVTGSGDKTVRVWSLNDYSCLRTFEGHSNSVLKVIWLPFDRNAQSRDSRGPKVASAAGDGLVKIWDVQDGECAATLDNHIDRVWSLAARPRDREPQHTSTTSATQSPSQIELVSGSADSTLTFWHDTTAATARATATRATARLEQDQELQNHISAHNYREAITLALQLNHPKRLLALFTSVMDAGAKDTTSNTGSITGDAGVDAVLADLSDHQLWTLLLRLRDWNTNARTAPVAQRVLFALFTLYPKERFVALRARQRDLLADGVAGMSLSGDTDAEAENKAARVRKETVRDVLDGLKAYTDKHYARLEKMAEERYVLLWTLQMMDETVA